MVDQDTTVPPTTADDWNRHVPEGTPVLYFPLRGTFDYLATRTRSPAWTLGSGHHVVKVDGVAGGVSLDHLRFHFPPTEDID